MNSAFDFADLVRRLPHGATRSGAVYEKSYECDAYTIDKFPPSLVAFPTTETEVQTIVRWCREHQCPLTPRGAGTSLSGGAMPAQGGIVLSTKRLTQILEIDCENRCLHAQSGAVNSHLSNAVKSLGLHFAPDPSSQSVCTLGGNISENSGGPHTLKYGVTSNHILQIRLVDCFGDVQILGSRVEGDPSFDLKSLVVGGEGTLGIVTSAWIKLVPLPECVETSLAAFPDVRSATNVVTQIISEGIIPAAIELMDSNIMVALESAFGLRYPKGAGALLLLECDGPLKQTQRDMKEISDICHKSGCLEFRRAKSDAERAELWFARKKGIGAMGRLAPTIVTHDGVIPRSKLPETLEFITELAHERGLQVANLFHAGDGNLHPCFYFDERVPGATRKVVEAGEEILKRCMELGGSITGEHGLGIEKAGVWGEFQSDADLKMQMAVRETFQVPTWCNPCKIIPNQKGCIEHKVRWSGAAT